MNGVHSSIKDYLASLETQQRADGYLCLNDKNEVIESDGWIGNTNLNTLDHHSDPVQSVPILEGLLPANSQAPTVIHNVHVDQEHYFDIHLFSDSFGAWVLFIDKTHAAKILQQEQQVRLTDDFQNDKRRTGN